MVPIFIRYGCLSFVLALSILLANIFMYTGQIHGPWHAMTFLFWVTIGPGAGMCIGALIRQWLLPDTLYTTEGMSGLFKAKLFWTAGPQGIGWLLGLLSVSNQLQ